MQAIQSAIESTCLSDDFLHALVQIEWTVDARFVALRHQSVDLNTVPLRIKKITRNRVSHLLVSVAYAMVDRHSQRLEPFVVRLDVGRRLDAPGNMRDNLGFALASLGQSELVILDLRIRRHEYHASWMLTVFNKPDNVPVERRHLVQIIHVKHHVAKPFDLRHVYLLYLVRDERFDPIDLRDTTQ